MFQNIFTLASGFIVLALFIMFVIGGLSESEIQYLLANDITRVRSQLIGFSWFQGLDEIRQGALINLTFNIGIGSLLHFVTAIHYLSVKDYVNSAAAFLDSVWAKQTGDRAIRLARQLETGEWQ